MSAKRTGLVKLQLVKFNYMHDDIERTVALHQALNLKEWARYVLDTWTLCFYLGCGQIATDPHHIIRREVDEFRLIVENGIGACRKHHRFLEELPKKSYWKMLSYVIPRDHWMLFRESNPFG
jgi:hypothetical protein